jgi:DNA polymerase-3 subunit alpha
MNEFTCNFHTHTDFSIHDGFSKIPELVGYAKELGYTSLAITDHGTMTGAISFYEECKKQGIKPIIGCECYFTMDIDAKGDTYHLILLAKDLQGYRNLMRIDTYSHEHFYRKPRISFDILEKYHEGIVCTTACIAGPLSSDLKDYIMSRLISIFGEDLYIEIQPHDFEEQKVYNYTFISQYPEVKKIITLDSHYVCKDDTQYHRLWLDLDDDAEYYSSSDYYLMGTDEIVSKLSYMESSDIQDMIKNTKELEDKFNLEIPFGEQHYPVFCEDPERYVRDKMNAGWVQKGISMLPNHTKYREQANHELEVLRKVHYFNYFCIVNDMLKFCEDNNIPTGIGRGSVGGCLVAYLMGITKVDPIKYNLVFERFTNLERVTPCDIDTDVSQGKRQELIEYIKSKYGEAYPVRTVGTCEDKAAVQASARSLDIDPTIYKKMSKNINTVEDMPEKTASDKRWKQVAMKFRGHVQNYGKHPSAMLVSPEDICKWSPVEKQKDDYVVCYDFHQLEDQGLLKLDVLGLKTLDIIEDTKRRAGIDTDISQFPDLDSPTCAMLAKGDTEGCFQIESNVMTPIAMRMNVRGMEDLATVVALGRPGPLDSGMVETFLKRRNKQLPTTYDIPDLEPLLKDTEGVIIYQEQIMKIVQVICGYSLGEADNLRRIIGRKVVDEMNPVVEDMISRGIEKGHTREQMVKLTDDIKTFALYGFNLSHSLAYGKTAWVTSYLKCHYPAAFMASLLDYNCKDKPKLATYIVYCQNHNIRILPPRVNHHNCYSDYDEDGPYIVLGLNCIAGVGNVSIDSSDSDFEAFLEKNINVNKKALGSMVRAGVFSGNRDMMLQYIDWMKDKRKSKGEFTYVPTRYDDDMEQSKVIGVSFGDVLSKYDLSIVDGISTFGVEVLEVKGRKTKTGKPMAFVKVKDSKFVKDFVIFSADYKYIKTHKVYIMRVRNNRIFEFVEAMPLDKT